MGKRNGLYFGNAHIASIGSNSIENDGLINNLLVGSGDVSTNMNLEGNLDSEAFQNRNFSSITLPNITSVSDYAFQDCNVLTTVNLPKVTSIGSCAFRRCAALTTVDISNVTDIKNYTFDACSSLAEINLPNVTDVGDYAFRDCIALTTVNLPNATSIGSYAYNDCQSLTTVNLPKVTDIGGYTFQNCMALTTVNIPNVTDIGAYNFYGCTSLAEINLPNATSIGSYAFSDCTSLIRVDARKVANVSNYAFDGCTSLIEVNIPDITTIGASAFNDCTSLTTVNFPNLTAVGSSTFYDCTSLTSANIDISNIISIGSHAFRNCALLNELKNLSFHKLQSLNTYSFYGCSQVEKADIPRIITTLPSYVFYNCAALECLVLRSPTKVTYSSNALTGTPLKSGVGFIYVPATLIESYEADSSWSGCVFRALEDYPDIRGYVWEQRHGGAQYVENAWSTTTTSSTYTSTSSSVANVGTSYTFDPTTGKFTIDDPTTKAYSAMTSTSYLRSANAGAVDKIYKYSSKQSKYSSGTTRYYIYWKTKTATLHQKVGTAILNATLTTANRDAYKSGYLNEDGYIYIRLDANGSPEYDTDFTNGEWSYTLEMVEGLPFTSEQWQLSPSTCKCFVIKPTTDGVLTAYSTSDTNVDTLAYLTQDLQSISSDGVPTIPMESDDDSNGNGQFKITYDVTAGNTYYLYVQPFVTSSGNVSVTCTLT